MQTTLLSQEEIQALQGKGRLSWAPLDSYVTATGHPMYDEDQCQVYGGWYSPEDIANGAPDLTNTPSMQAVIHIPLPEWGQSPDIGAHLCCIYGWSTEEGSGPFGGWCVEVFTYNGADVPTYVFTKYPKTYEEAQHIAITLHPHITPQELLAASWDSHGTIAGDPAYPHKTSWGWSATPQAGA